MRKPNLQKLLSKWQKRLRLRDWDLQVQYVGKRDIEGVGQAKIDRRNMQATIAVLDPADNSEHGSCTLQTLR